MESRKAGQDYWFDHIAQWRTSELTRTAYCTRHGLKFYTFAYWIKGKRPAQPHCVAGVDQVGRSRNGSNSSMRLLGQVGSFSSVSFNQA